MIAAEDLSKLDLTPKRRVSIDCNIINNDGDKNKSSDDYEEDNEKETATGPIGKLMNDLNCFPNVNMNLNLDLQPIQQQLQQQLKDLKQNLNINNCNPLHRSSNTNNSKSIHDDDNDVDDDDDSSTATDESSSHHSDYLRDDATYLTVRSIKPPIQTFSSITPQLPSQYWSEPDATSFDIRGKTYIKDKTKIPSQPAAFALIAVDLVQVDKPIFTGMCNHPKERMQACLRLEKKRNKMKRKQLLKDSKDSSRSGSIFNLNSPSKKLNSSSNTDATMMESPLPPFVFCINIVIPGPPHFHFCAYYAVHDPVIIHAIQNMSTTRTTSTSATTTTTNTATTTTKTKKPMKAKRSKSDSTVTSIDFDSTSNNKNKDSRTPFQKLATYFFTGPPPTNPISNVKLDKFRDKTFKLIPRVVTGNFVVRKAVGGKPTLIGKKLKNYYIKDETSIQHFKLNGNSNGNGNGNGNGSTSHSRFFELIIDVGSDSVAQKVVKLAKGYAKSLVVDMAFVLEGKNEPTLPEHIMGSVRLHNLDFANRRFVEQP